MRDKLFKIPPYTQTVRLIWREDVDAYEKKHNVTFDLTKTESAAFCSDTSRSDYLRWVIILPCKWDEDLVWHEALHAAYQVLDFTGVKIESRNMEPLAYSQTWVVDRLIEFYEKG